MPAGAVLLASASFPRTGRLEGERLRELERRGAELEREGVVGVAFCFACSSIRSVRVLYAICIRPSYLLLYAHRWHHEYAAFPCQPHNNATWDEKRYLETLKHDANELQD